MMPTANIFCCIQKGATVSVAYHFHAVYTLCREKADPFALHNPVGKIMNVDVLSIKRFLEIFKLTVVVF